MINTTNFQTTPRRAAPRFSNGQVMVLICVSLIAIMGMIAVVTDFSFMQHQRNMMQTAADSAAMAGAEELNYSDVVTAGKADAATNGYTDGTGSVTVAMNNPPITGPNAGNSAYVEAIVTKPQPTYFLRVLGVSTMTVSARAVAYEGNGPTCIYVMNPAAPGRVLGQRQRQRTEQLRPAGRFEFVQRHSRRRQRVDHSAHHRSRRQLQHYRRRQPYTYAQASA